MAEAHLFSKKSSGWPAQLREMNKGSCHLGSSACRKCDWGKDALPFVCKVIRHVRELETKTEAWFRQLPAPVRSESQETSLSSESTNGNGERYVISDTDVSDQKFSSELCVQGVGLDRKDEQTTDLQKEVRAVLSEIIGLMEELKTECEKANHALKAERERVTMLGNKIDQLSLWWLHEFPEAVQKEYDICSHDIDELQWHIEVKTYHLQNLEDQVADADALNKKLQEEINLIRNLEDQLEEKLDLEYNIINDILPNQKEMTEIFNKANSDLNETQQEFDDTSANAEFEQKLISEELLAIESKTADLHKDLINAKDLLDIYTTRENEIQKQLLEAEELYNQLINESAEMEQQKNIKAESLKQLKIRRTEKRTEISVLTTACTELRNTLKERITLGKIELSQHHRELEKTLHELRYLEKANRELELNIESLNNDIKESRQERNKMKKEIRQMQEALKMNNIKLVTVKKQLSQVERTQSALKAKLSMLTKSAVDQEDQLKVEIEKLKKKIKEAMVLRSKLQVKAKAEADELNRIKEGAEKKKESVLKKVTQAEKIVESIEAKFKELEAIHKAQNETFLKLSVKLNEFRGNYQLRTDNKEKEKNNMKQQLIDGQKEYSDSFNQLNDTLKQIEVIREHFLQKQTLRNRLLNEIEKYKNSILGLRPMLEAAEFKQNNAENFISKLKEDLDVAIKRKTHLEEEHWKLINDRKDKRQEVRVKLALAFNDNTNRTEEYQQLQQAFKSAKNELADIYDDRQKTEIRIKDYLQLSVLHTRMHKALVEYSKQQGLYSQAGLAKSLALSNENARTIITVQRIPIAWKQTIWPIKSTPTHLSQTHPIPLTPHCSC
ncbi:coiled-coil domain-containing protein 178 isoform X2 [Chiloscyllium plagiosum]|uniref:coiled-coil domain-containing protein 178 isoform X2 n=1 Tax=Chiloscyllium plagiosum TaxID=36176 RepID=UPI001CB86688|nr:coiled-coil domain-containing protein 178 isoform X2 [Chiloscyllium plagiosum]